jgi:hypothetical protein
LSLHFRFLSCIPFRCSIQSSVPPGPPLYNLVAAEPRQAASVL